MHAKVATRQEIDEAAQLLGEGILLFDGLDEAFIGFAQRINNPTLAVYSLDKIIDLLVSRDGMSYDEAVEFAEFNICGTYIGEQTPIIVMNIDW